MKERKIVDYFKDFFEYLDVEKGLALKSQLTYQKFLKKFIDFLQKNNLSHLKPSQLSEKHIFNYKLFLSQSFTKKKEPLKKSTQNHYLIALRALLRYFVEKKINCLPPEKVRLIKLKSEQRQIKFLELEQIKRLLEMPNIATKVGLRDRAILESLFSTGMRVSELVSLNKDQIKIGPKTKDLEVVIWGKGQKARPVYFSERAVNFLKEYLKTRDDKEKALFIRYKGPKNSSMRLSPRSVENIVKKYSILAGLPSFTVPHTLRHSFATDLLMKGVDLREIQEFLGHKNISTTQIYAHLTSKKLREIHRKFHGIKKSPSI